MHAQEAMTTHDPITRFHCSLPSGLTAQKGHFISFSARQSPEHGSQCPGMQPKLRWTEGGISLCRGSHFGPIPTQPTQEAGSSPQRRCGT